MVQIDKKQILKASPYYFAQEINHLRMSPIHCEMMDFISEDPSNRKLLLCMRGAGKSEICRSYVTWYALNHPNERILIVSDTDGKAQSMLRAIKQTLESENVIQYYGDIRGSTWTDHTLMFKDRTVIYPEGNISACGSESGQVTGKHFDKIFIDDLVSFMSCRSELQRNRTREWLLTSLLPTLMASGSIICACTRYHGADVYNTIINDLNYNTLIIPPTRDGKATCFLRPVDDVVNEDGSVVLEGLESIKRNLGSVIYSLQYMNDVSLLMEGNIIQSQWLQWYIELPEMRNIIIACDPAISQKESADMTAIVVLGQDDDDQIHLIEYVNAHLTFNATLNKLKSLVGQYKPEKVLLEEISYQIALIQEAKRKITTCVISGVVPKGDKESRLRSVSPLFENERVYFKRSQNDVTDQLLTFPNVDRDDLCDAMSLGLSHYVRDSTPVIIF